MIHTFGGYLLLPPLILFPLALFMRARWLSLAAAVSVVCAALWYGPAFLAKNQPPATIPFRVVTFNINAGTVNTQPFEQWITQIAPDVLFLQETPFSYAGREIAALKTRFPFQTSPDSDQWGNSTFSKWPILARAAFGTDTVFKYDRIIIYRDGQQIVLYNVHLPSPQANAPRLRSRFRMLNGLTQFNAAARDAQLQLLIKAVSRETLPYLIGGDFNLSDQSPTYGVLTANLGFDTYREAGFGLGATWPNAAMAGLPTFVPPLIRIDYLWHSKRFRAVDAQVGPVLGSDHLPVIATFDILSDDSRK